MSRMGKILVVDDDPVFARFLNQTLDRAGLKCQHVTDPLMARGFVAATEIDIVLLDMEMPGQSGIELLKSLKRLRRSVEVIMISGVVDEAAIYEAYRQGAYGYCLKPIDQSNQVIHLIESALKRIDHWDQAMQRAESKQDYEFATG